VYGENLDVTLRLLTSNKLLRLQDADGKGDVRKRQFITCISTKREHQEVFGKTKKLIYQNLDNCEVRQFMLKRANLVEKSVRSHLMK
jgi:hypothetical protein